MQLPGFLRSLRIRRDLTLAQAATACGLSVSALSMVERGLRKGSEQSLTALAALYGSESDVVMLAGGRIPSHVADALRAAPEEAAVGALDLFAAYAPVCGRAAPPTSTSRKKEP